MKLTREQVDHVALLGRLDLTEEERELFAEQLGSILGHFEQLEALDMTGVPPTSHAVPLSNVLREDQVGACLPREEVLGQAPESEADHFRVPRVVD